MNRSLLLTALRPALVLLVAASGLAADPPPGLPGKSPGPLLPREEQGTFRLAAGFRIDLVASEPDVVDPVSMCFDAKGRIFVCEMRGYPNAGVGTGEETRGRIRQLTDRDGDGVFETSTIYAEGLRFPMGVTPWKDGVLVAVAPDIIYLQDTDDDGRADRKTVLYTGFNLANIQQLVNTLQWAADGWVHGLAGNNAGTIRSVEKPDTPPVTLQARGFRFRPEVPGSLEPTSGGGQYGLAPDDFGHWFTATNSQHLRQIVIPDHYLRRNPSALVTAVTLDIPDHGAACMVFRISPFVAWRVERTTRGAGGDDARRFPTTELVPGGYATSACSPVIYTAELFPPPYRGNSFVCDPANNLIHRDVLERTSAVFTAKRGEADCEFLASTDNWFRPVHLTVGPDGALYVLDFYREVIETPLSLPDDIKAKLNLESRDRGRIWRIAPASNRPARLPDLAGDDLNRLIDRLVDANPWIRLTAHRLLCERADKPPADRLLGHVRTAGGKAQLPLLLSALDRFGLLSDEVVRAALADSLPGNREVALRFAEPRLGHSPQLRSAAVKLANDSDPMVRFQLALSAGYLPPADAGPVLAALVRRDGSSPWTSSAILCSARDAGTELLESVLVSDAGATDSPAIRSFVTRTAFAVAAKGDDAGPVRLIGLIAAGKGRATWLDLAVLDGLGQGMRGKRGLTAWLADPPPAARESAKKVRARFDEATRRLASESADPGLRIESARLLAYAPLETASGPLVGVLTPASPPELQLAAVRALAAHAGPKVTPLLLDSWTQLGPSVRREVLEQLLSVPGRIPAFLAAVEAGKVRPSEVEPARIAQLKAHPNAGIRTRAAKAFAGQGTADRKKLIDEYRPALELTGDPIRGQAVFKQHCAACHKLGDDGHEVGPNLLATIPGKSGEDLLISLLDPNREVDPRYLSYVANVADGRTLTGIVTAETAAAVVLRRSDGVEDTIRRGDLDSLKSSGLSLMPDGMEKNVSKQDVADLFSYLRKAVGPAPPKK
jgi:putative membrane-bound dehydrogenase-like protein